jgi:hypothetical protein
MKGFFTQGVALLLDKQVALEELAPLLENFGDLRRIPAAPDWARGGESLLLPFLGGAGQVAVDVIGRPWPDEVDGGEELLKAWTTGYFGPFAFPYSYQRACRQAWIWKEAQAQPPKHEAFIRVRTTYQFGEAAKSGPPEEANPLVELQALTAVAIALASHPAVVCYFNPNGEVVLPPNGLAEAAKWAREQELPPLDAWSNVRFLDLEGVADGWFLMDTVGMWQLDIADHEIALPGKTYDFQEVEGFLRNVALYLMNHGPIFEDGDTIDGPGGTNWRAKICEESFTAPPRPTIRWFAAEGPEPPAALTESAPPADPQAN